MIDEIEMILKALIVAAQQEALENQENTKMIPKALTAIYEIGLEVIGSNWELYSKGNKYSGKLSDTKKALNEQYLAVNSEKARMREAWAKACGVAEK